MRPNTRHTRANTGYRIALGTLISIVSLLCFLSNIGALGGVGRAIASFTIGFFGLASYAYAVMGIIIGGAVIFNFRVKMPIGKILLYFGLLAIGILALHVFSSSAHLVGANYGDYLLSCYNNTNTAGGMLFGIVSFPLMRAITTVGALVVIIAAFFALAFVAFFPFIKKNVVYSAATKSDRKNKRRVYSTAGRRIDTQKAPTITDFSHKDEDGRQELYVVDVEGDTLRKKDRRSKGADGYNPLYPNGAGAIEDDETVPVPMNFSPRGLATDILYGDGADTDVLDRFSAIVNPTRTFNVGAPYTAVRRSELRSRLGVDDLGVQETYSLPRNTEGRGINKNAGDSVAINDSDHHLDFNELRAESPKDKPIRIDFEQLERENVELFREQVSREIAEKREQEERERAAKDANKEVIKPSKIAVKPDLSDKAPQVDAVNMAGIQGVVRRAITGEELPAPEEKKEFVVEAYEVPAESLSQEQSRQTQRPTDFMHDEQRTTRTAIEEIRSRSDSARDSRDYSPVAEKPHNNEDSSTSPPPSNANEPAKSVNDTTTYVPPVSLEDKKPPMRDYRAEDRRNDEYAARREAQNRENSRSDIVQPNGSGRKSDVAYTANLGQLNPRGIDSEGIAYQGSLLARGEMESIARARRAEESSSRSEKQIRRVNLPKQENIKDIEKRVKQLESIKPNQEAVLQVTMDQAISAVTPRRPYTAPPINLLDPPVKEPQQHEDYVAKKRALIDSLAFFNIEAAVTNITVGPTFSLYTLTVTMPKGKTVKYLSSLECDIAMRMEEESVRILAPIPGRNECGIEVPNKYRRTVRLSELLNAPKFNDSKSPVTFALGKDLHDTDYSFDIKTLTHMLIAGATGAGKSCCINSVIVSLMYKASPEDLRMIMIDLKRVELSIYVGIPHLMLDEIVCEADKAIRALKWAIAEMDRRNRIFQQCFVRDLDEYNQKCTQAGLEKMPRIVIIVDELAELMSTGKKEVEDAINQLARLSRAAGIHMILATQRPSTDVISGTIKNNLPARISFKVTSRYDSQTVLDSNGAEALLGNGDLLFKDPKKALPLRMQGAFISTAEVERVVNFVKKHNDAVYDARIKEEITKAPDPEPLMQSDKPRRRAEYPPELFEAMQIGMYESITASSLQRKLGLGWPKAAKIMDTLKELGVLVPNEKDPKRFNVNLNEDEYEQMVETLHQKDEDR